MENIRRAVSAFVVTIMTISLCLGLYYVSHSLNRYGYAKQASIISTQKQSEYQYQLSVFGANVTLDTTLLNTISHYRKKYFALTPAPIRLLEQTITLYQNHRDWQEEQQRTTQFEQYVADSLQ